jgi:GGDEF domain-containing protein
MSAEPLMNRDELEQRIDAELSHAFRHGTRFGVVLIVPEDIGSGAARRVDELGERLREMIRLEDVVGRLDERTFAIVARGLSPNSLRQLADWLSARLLARHPQTGVRTLVSVGVAVAEPLDDRECAELLLWRAGVALERARSSGGSRVKA